MAVTPVTNTAASANATAKTSLNQNFDQFLRLLTTQLKNQDPLSPMDSTEFTNQLVNFSQVEQQIKTNDNLSQLVALTQTSQTTLGLSFIGLNVDINDSGFEYFGEGSVSTAYTLPSEASMVTISVLDKDGNSVYTTTGELASGKHSFTWDGKGNNGEQLPEGVYQVRVGALDTTQKALTAQITVPGFVSGIKTADDGSLDLVIGKLKPRVIPLSSVTQATL